MTTAAPVTVILDPGARDEENPLGGWTALAVIDDRLATIIGGREGASAPLGGLAVLGEHRPVPVRRGR